MSALRERAGRTVRDVARLANLPPATAGGYFSGRHLPAVKPPDQLEAILRACGVTEPDAIEAWTRALARVRRAPGPRPAGAPVPYRGLASFGVDDAEWFFGREALTDRLIKAMVARWWDGGIVVVVGPSGAGKSSLIHAGAIAALRSGTVSPPDDDRWRLVRFTPGPHPRLPATHGEVRTVIVVDQFEELFTACRDEAERRAFADTLCEAEALVVIGLRADFYDQALRLPQLAPALQDSQIVVGPMSEEELRRAIVEPARRAKLELDEGLVELLLRDHAGGLPLLSHALRATWERSHHGRLTVADYQATGGVRGAVARTAEEVFAGLSAAQQEFARQMFLRLVQVTPGTIETRRPIAQRELTLDDDARVVLERFIEARLVTADRDQLQIAHEALLTAWPRLRSWIDADRTGLRMHRQLTEAAQIWQESARDPHTLLRGGRLATAEEWHADEPNRARLNDLEREFLAASIEYDRAEARAARRRTKRLQYLTAALAVLLVGVGSLSVFAFRQRAIANEERDLAVSRQVAIAADQLRETDPVLAMQLALAAYRTAHTPEARSSLLGAYVTAPVTRVLGPPGVMQAVAVTRDRATMATAGADRSVRLWHLPGSAPGPVLSGHTDTVFALAFSPDGKILASGSGDKTVRLWDVADPARARPIGTLTDAGNTVYSLAFSPDGQTLAAGSADKTIHLWRVSDRASIGTPLAFDNFVQSVAFSPDGQLLAAGSADKTVRLWRVSDWTPVGPPLTGPTKTVFSVAFSPDGQLLAAGSADKTVRVWRVSDLTPVGAPLAAANGWVNAVAFDPDGQSLAAASSDGHIWIWSTSTWRITASLPHPAPVTNLGYLGGDHTLASSAADGTARLWRPPGPVLGGPSETVFNALFARSTLLVTSGDSTAGLWDTADPRQPRPLGPTITDVNVTGRSSGAAAISPDARTVAVGGVDGKIRLWDVTDPAHPSVVPTELAAHTSVVESLAFSNDGRLLAAGSDDKTTSLWDVADPAHPTRLGTPLTGPTNYVYGPAFRPDGRLLAAGSADNHVYLWDIADPRKPVPLAPLGGPTSYVYAVAFSPDGHTLAAGSADNTVRLWDITDPRQPVLLGAPLTGPDNYVFSVTFSGDGHTLAAGAGNGTIWLWDVTDRHHPLTQATLTGHTAAVFTVAFDPGRPLLASGGADKLTRLWLLDPEAVATQICATTGDPITPAEWRKYVPGRPYRNPCR